MRLGKRELAAAIAIPIVMAVLFLLPPLAFNLLVAAVALAARRFSQRQIDAAAMMRCLGAPQRQMLALFALQFLVLGLASSVVGCLVALGGQQLLVTLLGAMVSTDLPPPGLLPAVAAMATGLLMLLGFALPPLFALSKVPPSVKVPTCSS